MESNLIKVLDGEYLDEITSELCDFTIEEQNSVAESQGLNINNKTVNIPVLGSNICYIVACIIFNDNDEILMIQEAKESCAGKWYLPAGRLERNENLIDGCKREVLEETGLIVDIKTLLAVEVAGGHWFRFIFFGEKITGGKIKTYPDEESLQAKWISNLDDITLRSKDILNAIELARKYKENKPEDCWHKNILPVYKPHDRGYLRLIIVAKNKTTNSVHVLLSEKNAYHFPTCEIHSERNIHATLRKFMIELFGSDLPPHRPHGILTVEYSPIGNGLNTTDGLCLTVLVPLRINNLEDVGLIGKCSWLQLSKEVQNRLISTVISKNGAIGFHVVR